MLPTFDFVNLVNRAVRIVIAAVANPITIITSVSVAIAGIAATYISWWSSVNIPSLDPLSFSLDESDWLPFLLYCIDYETVCTIWNFASVAFVGLLTLAFSFAGSLFVGYWVFNVSLAIRSSVKDMGA